MKKTEKVILHYLQPHQIQGKFLLFIALNPTAILLQHDKTVYSKAKKCSSITMYKYVRAALAILCVFNF